MSKRLKLSDLAKVVAQKAATSASKGVVISEGSETTSSKRALDDASKGKQVTQLPESKRAKINTGASEAPARPPIASGEGSSAKRTLGEALGPQASVMASAATAEKILAGVILPADKEKVDRLTFDQVVTKFLHVLGQGVILGSSLAFAVGISPRTLSIKKAVAESAEMEMVRAQNWAIELEGALAEEKAKGKKLSEDADARDKVIARLEARISDLERSQSLTQGRIIAAFKESDDFLEAVRGSASSYFGDGFDFCKRQLAHQYPDLGVDLKDVEMDHELLAKEEAEAEKTAAEEGAAGPGGASITADSPKEPRGRELKCRIGSPSNIKGWKTRFFFASGDKWEFFSGTAVSDSIPRVPRSWECQSPGGYFEVSKVLGSRTFRKHFAAGCTALSTSGRDNTTSGDDGKFVTREDSVEYLGVIRRDIGGVIRRALPGIPDETLLRWLGGKVKDPFTNLLSGKSGSSSGSGSDSISDSELPPELRSDAISARVGAPALGEKTRGKAKAEKAVKATTAKPPTKGVVIREKRAREGDHVIEIGEPDSSKGKEAAPPPPLKRFKSNRGATNVRGRAAEVGTSSPGGIGSESMMSDASAARRLLTGVILASDKKEVDQLSENDLVAKSFHALVKAENRLAELSEEGSKPGTEVDDLKATVAELTNKLAKAKELAIEDFKASGEFKAAVTDSAATYFSEGFEFCKRQLLHQFPNLGVDVANMAMDPNFAEEEEAMKEGEDPVAGGAPDV
ncbi:hypothetical protein Acr_27g0001540 [Actinidia rufa]|uniref:Uncharacterized protein n=1 Tax=Actinidia rufa TaxID=165716 RepID=A0A7J0H625_9ERIC|nr:hypothetical protein Acr_27g0001540 [Actinidia rufa]